MPRPRPRQPTGTASKSAIAELLRNKRFELARIKTYTVVQGDYLIEVYAVVSRLCDALLARLPLVIAQKACPSECHEAVCSLLFAAPYLFVEELRKLRKMFLHKVWIFFYSKYLFITF